MQDEQGESIAIKDAHLDKLQALAGVAMSEGKGAAFVEGVSTTTTSVHA